MAPAAIQGRTTLPLHAPPTEATGRRGHARPTLSQVEESPISQVAKSWLGKDPTWKADIIEQIYNEHLQNTAMVQENAMLLELNQYLEKYLWPHYNAKNASTHHIVSIALMVNEKCRQRINPWDIFASQPKKFSQFFASVLHLLVPKKQTRAHDSNLSMQTILLLFIINSFQSLENSLVRQECMRLTSLSIWNCLNSQSLRQRQFAQHPPLRKVWNLMEKRYESADAELRQRMEYDQSWLSQLLTHFVETLFSIDSEGVVDPDTLQYVERFMEFVIDLQSQLPTRRYVNTLLFDHQILIFCQKAPLRKRQVEGDLYRQLLQIFQYYCEFELNDQNGAELSETDMTQIHSERLVELQKLAFTTFKDSIQDLALESIAIIEKRENLQEYFSRMSVDDIHKLCDIVGVRTVTLFENERLPAIDIIRESLIQYFERKHSQIEQIDSIPLYPDEQDLFNDTLIGSQFYDGASPLALPKLNLQFLTLRDYLLRNFNLFRLESHYEIRQDLEDVIKRLAPRFVYPEMQTQFSGWARMAMETQGVQIVDVGQPSLGDNTPSVVKADITFDVGRYADSIKKEWDSLKRHDVLFLLSIEAHEGTNAKYNDDTDFKQHFGLQYVRGCEVLDFIGGNGKPIEDLFRSSPEERGQLFKGSKRTIRVQLDANQYQMDLDRANKKDSRSIYDSFNILVRRNPQENNFKAVLQTMRKLMHSEVVVPVWLQKVFLGYGDPASAHYSKLLRGDQRLNFRDTFLHWDHLKESFPKRKVAPAKGQPKSIEPPYVLEFHRNNTKTDDAPTTKKTKAAKNVQPSNGEVVEETIAVETYQLPNQGPYPEDAPKQNAIEFTPTQVEAIRSSMSPGLSLIVGPPGTGKTDVAVQTIANLYHNYPNQHILLVTHSNQALNQLFEKIIALDIDPRHLLRLGHGVDELNTELSFSKYGRVDSFLERRLQLLEEVTRLAQSLNIPGEHGYTCETAGYFFNYHIVPRWDAYEKGLDTQNSEDYAPSAFPFTSFFSNAPKPLFTDSMTLEEMIEIVRGCYRHLKKIFEELEEIRAFEILKSSHDRANYLLTKEAKIIAMTCTHAALKREELVNLNFKYDTIIMEEAAQILEIETFIPMFLQEPEDGRNRLQRVILIGDHNQLPPVVKNTAFQHYGNMEQSLFTRFVKLGVPTIDLDAQGRARASLADLYRWRYKQLGDLPMISQGAYTKANAGFTFDYQLVNVGNYNGQGESEPVKYFYQNLGEAEYVVAVYQYMRLIGYPAEKITILTTYNGQRALIKDVLDKRCAWNPIFGKPAQLTTVDKYQGQQNDYVLLSLVRTRSIGHIRDVRRLIVALSRARLGLYIFCRADLFENCPELAHVFEKLSARPSKLQLRLNERYETERDLSDTSEPFEINDVAHMGAYVYQMMQEQMEFAKQQNTANEEADGVPMEQD